MVFRVLIMGLPGAGKTTLAASITADLFFTTKLLWLNADTIREKYNDWDFSEEGRIRQSVRMRQLADESDCDVVIADFVAPLEIMRDNFSADIVVYVDTITEGRYADTNKMFSVPKHVDIHVTEQDTEKWSKIVEAAILEKFNKNNY